jgi:polyribonucleotide nucleotidyltransferase
MEGPEITFAEAVIDNGRFGTRTVRFETGRLAKQAAGAVTAYLDDDTMLLSTTAAGKSPKDQFDFFPLTVDVEERMYAIGKIPGSFFRREGRPSTEAVLTCRLIDRPLRPTFKKGLRNEVQVIISVFALNPDHQYDVLAINAASASTQISGLPFSGPVGGVRVSLIEGQWVAFPNFSDIERSVFDMVVAGRVVTNKDGDEDVAIMMVEAEATDSTWDLVTNQGVGAPTEEIVAEGLEASKKFIAQLCKAQNEVAANAAKPVEEFPYFLDYNDDAYDAVEHAVTGDLEQALQIAGKQEREDRPRRDQGPDEGLARAAVRGPREGAVRRIPCGAEEAHPQADPHRRCPHRRPRPARHPRAVGRGRGAATGARVSHLRARRDPDHGRHHAEHAEDGAAARHPLAGDEEAVHAQLQLPALQHR